MNAERKGVKLNPPYVTMPVSWDFIATICLPFACVAPPGALKRRGTECRRVRHGDGWLTSRRRVASCCSEASWMLYTKKHDLVLLRSRSSLSLHSGKSAPRFSHNREAASAEEMLRFLLCSTCGRPPYSGMVITSSSWLTGGSGPPGPFGPFGPPCGPPIFFASAS